jgi:hypothetical protein
MSLEPSDLNMQATFGVVCTGKLCDFVKLRDDLRKYPGIKLVFNTISAEYLFIVKKSGLTADQLERFEKEMK